MMQQQPQVGAQPGMQMAGAGYEAEALRNLMVNYIPTQIDELQLRQLFEMYGPIETIKIVTDRETKQSKGFGFVKYRFAFSAMHAIQYLNGYPLMNKRLKVAYANQSEAQKAAQAQAPSAYGQQMADPQQLAQMQQMNYMQQVAAMQMMQYNQMAQMQMAGQQQQQMPQQFQQQQ
jgi:RNA recognition motif-containing protein